MSVANRVECPLCERQVGLYSSGKLYRHHDDVAGRCSGSLKLVPEAQSLKVEWSRPYEPEQLEVCCGEAPKSGFFFVNGERSRWWAKCGCCRRRIVREDWDALAADWNENVTDGEVLQRKLIE